MDQQNYGIRVFLLAACFFIWAGRSVAQPVFWQTGLDKNSVARNFELKIYADSSAKKELLSHILYQNDADCNSEEIQLGDYDFRNDTLILYTCWCNAGDPTGLRYGVQIATYHWNKDALKLEKISSRISLSISADAGSGELAPGETDPELLHDRNAFIAKVSEVYQAEFVPEEKAGELITLVKKRLASQIDTATATWPSRYSSKNNSFGYRR